MSKRPLECDDFGAMAKVCREANRVPSGQLAHGVSQEDKEEARRSPRREEELRLYLASQEGKEDPRNTRRLAEHVAYKELCAAFKRCDFCRAVKTTHIMCLNHSEIYDQRCAELLEDKKLRDIAEALGVE